VPVSPTVGGVSNQALRTFFVESYVPRLDERAAETLSSRLQEMIRRFNEEGTPVLSRGSFALLDEETYVCIVVAPTIDDVVELSARVGLERDHVVEAVALDLPARRG
jgi:hypothetical protein